MKFRLLTILLAGLLLTGCGQNTAADNTKTKSSISAEATTTDTKETAAETSSDETTSDETTEQEPYLVTFEATSTDGTAVTSDILNASKLTMLNVWATYCNPCLSEMPDLGELAVAYEQSEFQILGIISDVSELDDEDAIAEAVSLIKETNADTYPHVLLSQSLYTNLVGGISGVPTTFFINQKGELLGYVTGAQTKETWEKLINELLAELD